MRIAYLDCFSGISGDMFLGALVDAGVPFELLEKTVADLNIGAPLELSRVDRAGISACKVDVRCARGEGPAARGVLGSATAHGTTTVTSRPEDAGLRMSTEHGRHLKEILRHHCRGADQRSCKADRERDLQRVRCSAEAKVHNVAVEQIHFHEVGSEDAIVDVVCAAVGAESLGVEQFFSSPLNVGGGSGALCPRGDTRARACHTRVAKGRSGLFRGDSEGISHAYRCGDRQGAGEGLSNLDR